MSPAPHAGATVSLTLRPPYFLPGTLAQLHFLVPSRRHPPPAPPVGRLSMSLFSIYEEFFLLFTLLGKTKAFAIFPAMAPTVDNLTCSHCIRVSHIPSAAEVTGLGPGLSHGPEPGPRCRSEPSSPASLARGVSPSPLRSPRCGPLRLSLLCWPLLLSSRVVTGTGCFLSRHSWKGFTRSVKWRSASPKRVCPSTGVGASQGSEDFSPRASSRGPASPGAGPPSWSPRWLRRKALMRPALRPPEKQKERVSGNK